MNKEEEFNNNQLEEIFEPTMTVDDFYKYCGTRKLKILSGFNGKTVCKEYKPKLHSETIGKRIIIDIWSEIEIYKNYFGNYAKPILVCYVHGDIEYKQKIKEKNNE